VPDYKTISLNSGKDQYLFSDVITCDSVRWCTVVRKLGLVCIFCLIKGGKSEFKHTRPFKGSKSNNSHKKS
jgi:hypothetical protein